MILNHWAPETLKKFKTSEDSLKIFSSKVLREFLENFLRTFRKKSMRKSFWRLLGKIPYQPLKRFSENSLKAFFWKSWKSYLRISKKASENSLEKFTCNFLEKFGKEPWILGKILLEVLRRFFKISWKSFWMPWKNSLKTRKFVEHWLKWRKYYNYVPSIQTRTVSYLN